MFRFSVVIPAFNAANTIRRCIYSLSKQTLTDFEILLVADDNVDYAEILVDFKLDIKYFRTDEVASGPSCARNIGLTNSLGENICYIDADDSISSNRLELFYLSLKDNPIVCDYPTIIDFDGSVRCPAYPQEKSLTLESLLRLNFPVKIAHKNNDKIRFYDSLRFAEDTVFNALAICLFDSPVYIECSTEYFYFLQEKSLTSNSFDYIDSGYKEIISVIGRDDLLTGKQKSIMLESFWIKRKLNKLYFEFIAEFGYCSFYSFSKRIG